MLMAGNAPNAEIRVWESCLWVSLSLHPHGLRRRSEADLGRLRVFSGGDGLLAARTQGQSRAEQNAHCFCLKSHFFLSLFLLFGRFFLGVNLARVRPRIAVCKIIFVFILGSQSETFNSLWDIAKPGRVVD
jgi:hypothetical protein